MASRMIVSDVASSQGENNIMVMDIKGAFLYGDIEDIIYIELPDEDPRKKDGFVGRLRKAMYGTRAAPQVWQSVVKQTLTNLGFEASIVQPCVYFHRSRDLRIVTHVDDFLCGGPKASLLWLRKQLQNEFELKSQILGDGVGEDRAVKFLGRTIRWESHGIEIEGDNKHVKVLLEEWNMSTSKPVTTPGTSEEKDGDKNIEEDELLVGDEATFYRRAAARLNYMALDRMDLSFAAKEIARTMATPNRKDIPKIKRVIRYLRGTPSAKLIYRWQDCPSEILVYSDSDWAGCQKTRKSTSGGVLMHGSHALTHWSSTQATIALSVAEAELNALIKAAVEAAGASNLGHELDMPRSMRILTDSNSAKGICQRQGTGKVKHLECRQLWLQERVLKKSVKIEKIPREQNSSDSLTHYWSCVDAKLHFARVGFEMCG